MEMAIIGVETSNSGWWTVFLASYGMLAACTAVLLGFHVTSRNLVYTGIFLFLGTLFVVISSDVERE